MAFDQFIPEFWSAAFLRNLDASLIYAQPGVVNRNYEGNITGLGDVVHIFQVGDPTLKTYTPNTDIDAPERPDGTEQILSIDQFKYFNIAIDDVNRRQGMGVFPQYAARAARKVAEAQDAFVAAKLVAASGVGAVGTDASPITVKADGTGTYKPYAFFVQLGKVLDTANAPMDSRWAVVNPALKAEILNDSSYIPAGWAEQRNGVIGAIAGFDILATTRVPTSAGSGGSPVANKKVVAGAGNYSTTFAHQLTENEAYRIERQFGDGWKGLEVYGAKVIEPSSVVVGHVSNI